MREQIEHLVRWQALDVAAAAATSRIFALKETLSALDREMAEKKAHADDEARALTDIKKIYRNLEAESKNYLDMIARSNDKLSAVKTNKEYQSILKEIEETRKKHSDLEDRMIDQLNVIESQEMRVSSTTTQMVAFQNRCQTEKQIAEKQIDHEQRTIETVKQEMDQVLAAAAPETVAALTAVRKKCHGISVAPVQQAICMGCHMNIPAQLFNELLRFDEIRFCPHCHRIIYWKEKEVE